MIYKNAEIHNIAEIIQNEDGSISWKRVPGYVQEGMERSREMELNSTGVEIRFVIKGDRATVRMSAYTDEVDNFFTFHVFRGGIQGGWQDHELHRFVGNIPQDFVIEKSKNIPILKEITKRSGFDWDCEVIRIIFDRGRFKIYDIVGDIEPPSQKQCPQKTLLAYGSSITHGSNSIDMSHSWVAQLAHNLNMDARNLGMAGACCMEPAMAEYIAAEGEAGLWDIATLELGINVLDWNEEKIYARVANMLRQVAGRNPEKPVFVISPFYHCGDDFDASGDGHKWRKIIKEVTEQMHYPNVTYFNGLDILDNMEYMSADEIHPNIYGVQKIADTLSYKIKTILRQ